MVYRLEFHSSCLGITVSNPWIRRCLGRKPLSDFVSDRPQIGIWHVVDVAVYWCGSGELWDVSSSRMGKNLVVILLPGFVLVPVSERSHLTVITTDLSEWIILARYQRSLIFAQVVLLAGTMMYLLNSFFCCIGLRKLVNLCAKLDWNWGKDWFAECFEVCETMLDHRYSWSRKRRD